MRQLQSKAIIRQQAADESFDAEHSMLEYELVRIKTANKKLVVFIDALLSKYDV